MSRDTGQGQGPQRVGRRAEYAETTRRAIIDAARRLFSQNGYFATKVDEIAAAARVSPATVYAVTGGKQGLLHILIDEWTIAPVVATTLHRIEELDDPAEIIRTLAAITRGMRQDYGDIMRVVLAAAPHDDTAAKGLATATRRYRAFMVSVAKRLAAIGGLRHGMAVKEAADILWFYFGYSGFFILIEDNQWSYAKAERWLNDAAIRALR